MKYLALVVCLLGISISSYAQNYKTAIGFRYEQDFGVSVKHIFLKPNAIELVAARRSSPTWNWTRVGLHYIRHCHFFDSWGENLRWYYGGGPNYYRMRIDPSPDNVYSEIVGKSLWSFSGVLGSEFALPKVPILIGADWSPVYFFEGYRGEDLSFNYGSISIRYIFR